MRILSPNAPAGAGLGRLCLRFQFFVQGVVLAGGLLGCGLPQSDACETYVACQRHYDSVFDRSETDTATYQPDGVCWENQELADACTDDCVDETERLRERLTETENELGPCR